MSTLSAFPFIGEQSFATPGAFNSPLSIISANIAAINADVGAISGVTITPPSGNTIQIPSDLSISGYLSVGKGVSIGTQAPGIAEPVALTIGVNSGISDYLYFNDTSNQRSNYVIGSRAGGTADGLNIFDASGQTLIVTFSKQSTRFYVPVVAAALDQGGQIFNVQAYGAKGDGVTDDFAAIFAAITDAGIAGGTVYLPSVASWYVVSSTLTIPSNVAINGDARAWNTNQPLPSGISRSTNVPIISFQGTSIATGAHIQGMEIRSIAFHGANAGADMMILKNATNVLLDRVRFHAAGGRAIYAEELFDTNFYQVNCDFCGTSAGTPGIHIVAGVAAEPSNVIRFFDCVFETNQGRFLTISGGTTSGASRNHTIWLDRCKFESTAFTHQFVNAVNVYNLWVRDCTFIANNPTIASTASALVYLENVDSAFVRGFYQTGGVAATSNAINFIQMSGVTRAEIGGWFHEASTNTLTGTSAVSCSNVSQFGSLDAKWEFNPNNRALLGGTFSGLQRVGGFHVNAPLSVDTNKLFVPSANSFVGINTNTPLSVLHIVTGGLSTASGALLIADQTTNLATKVGFLGSSHYTINTAPFLGVKFLSDANNNTVAIGGGSGSFTPASIVQLFTATDPTVAGSGAIRLQVNSDGSVLIGNSSHTQVQVGGQYTTAIETTGLRLGTASGGAAPIEFVGGTSANGYGWRVKAIDLGSENVDLAFSRRVNSASWTTAFVLRGFTGQVQFGDGAVLAPASAFTSDASLGWYRAGVQTIAQSLGTFNLATNGVRLSMRTLAASSVTASAAKTNVAVNEIVFTLGGASGASLIIYSGGTAYGFNSAFSAVAS